MTSAAASTPLVRRRPPAHERRKRFLVSVAQHSVLIALAAAFLAPFIFIVLTSLMTTNQALSANLWPHPFRFQNFADVFSKAPLARWTFNTFVYSCLATMMLPAQVTAVPLYVMWSKLHLVGSLAPLIIPNWFGDAFSIFLLRQFFLTIPEEYSDAARVDGCGELRILLTVVLRLARPAIAAVGLFAFLYAWNDFFGPLLYTGENAAHWTLSLGLSQFRTTYQVHWNLTMMATILFMAPVIALFFAAQKAFVEGVTLTGVKG